MESSPLPPSGRSRKIPIPTAEEIQPPPPPPAPPPRPAPTPPSRPKAETPPRQDPPVPRPTPAATPAPTAEYQPVYTPSTSAVTPDSPSNTSGFVWLLVIAVIGFMGFVGWELTKDFFADPVVAEAEPESPAPTVSKPDETLPPAPVAAAPTPELPYGVPIPGETIPDGLPTEPKEPPPEIPRPRPRKVRTRWTVTEGFPFEYGKALAEWRHAQDVRDENRLRQKQNVADALAQLEQSVVAARAESLPVEARVMVIDANPQEVFILADVTAGWITDPDPNNYLYQQEEYARLTPQAGIVWIQPQGRELQPLIALRVGTDMTAQQAAGLRWGDRIAIEFKVRSIDDRPPPRTPSPAVNKPQVTVGVSDLRCLMAQARESTETVWAGPGTLPRAMGQSQELAQSLAPIMSLVVKHATARMQVKEVTERQVVLYRDLSEFNGNMPTVLLLPGKDVPLTLPIRAIGAERAAALTSKSRIDVKFDVRKLDSGWLHTNDLSVSRVNKYALVAHISGLEFIDVVEVE